VPEEEFADNSASSKRLPAFATSRPSTLSSAPLAGLEYRVEKCEQLSLEI
jgi:hypothetical protein